MCLIVVAGIMYLKAASQSSTQAVCPTSTLTISSNRYRLRRVRVVKPVVTTASKDAKTANIKPVLMRAEPTRGVQCENVGDQNKFIEGLTKCESAERDCWARCDASACR
jgi:hypothetical protein